ncbi:uncharacterized protein LOC122385373 [Amphibalanus amphitrite]|uniref:uncharacterized protein LOC122385373 n=1 Tax=Amphibalanus amphitrite TaxID=1232801 RepID=UPI001C915D8F|nr:uncharacterized protein LOC122385373 [Amphibalanus amphitrite]
MTVCPKPLETHLRERVDYDLKELALPVAIQEGCMFCGFPHPSEECRKVRDLTPAERRERLMRRGGCFWCLKPASHRAANCRQGKPRCSVCSGRHHPLLCDPSPAGTAATGSRSDDSVPSRQSVTVIAASCEASEHHNVVLMQTARVEASGLNGTRRVRVMCDSGSNTTFIRSDTAQKLG